MILQKPKSGNENGFVLVTALLFMMILAVIAIYATSSTNIELKIAANDREEKQIFYGTESGCMRGGQWLRNLQLSIIGPDYVHSSFRSDWGSGTGNDRHVYQVTTVADDGLGKESNLGNQSYPVKYSYDIWEDDVLYNSTLRHCVPMPGNDPTLLRCFYTVTCEGSSSINGGVARLEVQVGKPTQFN